MATKTLSDVRAMVRFRGDFRNTVRFPDANVDTEIQAAHAEWYELICESNAGFFDTTTTAPTVANQAYVALPADAWIIRAVDRQEGTEFEPMKQIGIDERNRYGTTTDRPTAFRLTARGADLFPTPNAVYTLRFTYTPVVTPLGDVYPTDFLNSWEEYVVYATLLRLAENEERSGNNWQERVDRQAARIKSAASQRRSSEPEYVPLRDHVMSDLDVDARRWP